MLQAIRACSNAGRMIQPSQLSHKCSTNALFSLFTAYYAMCVYREYTSLDLPQVSLEWVLIGSIQFIMRSVLSLKLKTDLIINWIDPIKTHSSETWGKSNTSPDQRVTSTICLSILVFLSREKNSYHNHRVLLLIL